MGRDRGPYSAMEWSDSLTLSIGSVLTPEVKQLELFSPDIIRRAGKPLHIVVRDPNRLNQVRTMIVASPKMRHLLEVLEQVAPTNETVLLLGESGTGKNWLAWLLHSMSARRERPFVELNVSQHPDSLIDSALFGHEKGSFTGASEAHAGSIALAEGGTLFINEAGDLSPASQLKLLRFLDDRVYEPVGGRAVRVSDVRVVAATHRDLATLVKEGKFREDLFYRLNVVSVRVPSLRERPEEIPPMAEAMLQEAGKTVGKPWLRWAPEALDFMSRLPWVGNLRALRNHISSAAILAKGEVLGPDEVSGGTASTACIVASKDSREDRRARFVQAYALARGNRSAMARMLSTCRAEIRRKIRQYGLES